MIPTAHDSISTGLDQYNEFQWQGDHHQSCHRCGGLLAKEFCCDLQDETEENWFWALRCLQCGEVFDPVIVHNRHTENPSEFKARSRRKPPVRTSNL
ncbi:hypothetical protein [Nitrospira sp. M1]